MAAKRSGSGWHVDPANSTGWLALIQGAKLWGMYPPSVYHIPGQLEGSSHIMAHHVVSDYSENELEYQ